MPTTSTLAPSNVSHQIGARSAGPAPDAVRHRLTGRTFFLLPDEDPQTFREHEATWLAVWRPRDRAEQEAAEAAIRAMWCEIRGDRLEVQVLTDLFAAGRIADEAERAVAKTAAFKALACLLRYQARVARAHRQALDALAALRQRRPAGAAARPHEPAGAPARPHEPEIAGTAPAPTATAAAVARRDEPETATVGCSAAPGTGSLNRHQRRALAAMDRQATRRAA